MLTANGQFLVCANIAISEGYNLLMGECRRLHEELYDLYPAPNIFRVMNQDG